MQVATIYQLCPVVEHVRVPVTGEQDGNVAGKDSYGQQSAKGGRQRKASLEVEHQEEEEDGRVTGEVDGCSQGDGRRGQSTEERHEVN